MDVVVLPVSLSVTSRNNEINLLFNIFRFPKTRGHNDETLELWLVSHIFILRKWVTWFLSLSLLINWVLCMRIIGRALLVIFV